MLIGAFISPTVNGSPLGAGDEIAAFTPSGTCAGAVVWTSQNTALTIWGKSSIGTGDGFGVGDPLSFRVWDDSAAEEVGHVQVTYDPAYLTEGMYVEDGIYALTSLTASREVAAEVETRGVKWQVSVWPNPAAGRISLDFHVRASEAVELVFFDALGREVVKRSLGRFSPGRHQVGFDASLLPAGTYLLRLRAGALSATTSLVILR